MPTPRRVPDDLWAEIAPLLPTRPSRAGGGRPPADDRRLLDALLYVLWGGIPWRAMPKEFGPWQTVYDRFSEWRRAGVFEDVFRRCLHLYEARHGIAFDWQAADGTYVRSPLGGKDNGPNPTDRAKPGMKGHLLVDGRGVPLSILVTPANVNESPQLDELIEQMAIVRLRPTSRAPQHLALDAAFDNGPARAVLYAQHYIGHIAPKGGRDESHPRHPGAQARRSRR